MVVTVLYSSFFKTRIKVSQSKGITHNKNYSYIQFFCTNEIVSIAPRIKNY